MSAIAGFLIAEWPRPEPGRSVNASHASFRDAVTGTQIGLVRQATFHVAAGDPDIYADLMLPVDAAGNRVPEFQSAARYGEFRFLVTEMRVRP